ncbi:MAG: hypothetical protein IPH95_19830 [Candidatus Promineofilum sp.]|nr:hypothetical protein [Promineifilum sp.]
MHTRVSKLIAGSALAVALLAAVLGLLAVPTANAAPLRQDATPVPNAEDCTGCHEGLRGYWEQSAHGYALVDPAFQKAWMEAGSPDECLACHTTGFDPETGEFKEGGVGCLACHSPFPATTPKPTCPPTSPRVCAAPATSIRSTSGRSASTASRA